MCKEYIRHAEQQNSNDEMRKATLRRYLRLRMACNNGTFERQPPSWDQDPLNMSQSSEGLQEPPSGDCPTCYHDLSASESENSFKLNLCETCSSKLCRQCLPEYVTCIQAETSSARRTCGICHRAFLPRMFSARDAHFDMLSDEEVDASKSTKLDAIISDIEKHKHQCNRYPCPTPTYLAVLTREILALYFLPGKLVSTYFFGYSKEEGYLQHLFMG